jgi:hypothetical protein
MPAVHAVLPLLEHLATSDPCPSSAT